MAQRKTLKPDVLKDLIAKKAVDLIYIQDAEEGFSIRIGFRGEDKLLGLVKQDRARVFKTLKGAKAHLAKLGIEDFRVDATRRSVPAKGGRRVATPRYESEADFDESLKDAIAQIDAGTAELIPWKPGFFRAMADKAIAEHEAAMATDPNYRARRAAAKRKMMKPCMLELLVFEESINSVRIQESADGFRILISFDGDEQPLGLVKEDRARAFKTRKSAETHLNKLGIAHLNADAMRAKSPKTTMSAKASKRHLLN